MRVRVILALLVWVQVTLVCRGHTRGHHHIGPHLVLGMEPRAMEEISPLPNEQYIRAENKIEKPSTAILGPTQKPIQAALQVCLVGVDLTEGLLSSILGWVE